jgi:predicted TIM-barrel enzyme
MSALLRILSDRMAVVPLGINLQANSAAAAMASAGSGSATLRASRLRRTARAG